MSARKLLSHVTLLCWFFALLTFAPYLLAQQSKTLAVRPITGELAGRTLYTNSHALLIGISRYAFLRKAISSSSAPHNARFPTCAACLRNRTRYRNPVTRSARL
ncbi:MAG: hypothetical protein ABJA67_11595 [Chthonomonadales bacterium]